jgi:hypothetical protein
METHSEQVACHKKMLPNSTESWIDALQYKLADIGITTVSEVCRDIITLNKWLNKNGHPMLHTKTLNLFARVAEEQVKECIFYMRKELTHLKEDLAISKSKERAPTKEEIEDSRLEEEQNMRVDHEWSKVEVTRDMALIATYINIDVTNIAKEATTKNTWLRDSAASCHLCDDDDGMFDWNHINVPIKIGNSKALIATKIGKLRRTIVQKDGTTVDVEKQNEGQNYPLDQRFERKTQHPS